MDLTGLADEIGASVEGLSAAEAGHLIGRLYTGMMPEEMRSRLGAYYTPPILVDRLIGNISSLGFDWRSGRILDPACGGAAFLAPVGIKVCAELQKEKFVRPAQIIEHMSEHLHGIEIDPFAAWISQILVEAALLDICISAKRRLPALVTVADALVESGKRAMQYDLVIGNPPYGKVSLSPHLRSEFSRSVYGHANLYGLFIDLAERLTNSSGIVAYIASSSFLGGQYFKELRQLLGENAQPVMVDFITERTGVFEDVLQETILAVFGKGQRQTRALVSELTPNGYECPVKVKQIGKFSLPTCYADPWLFPRSAQQKRLLSQAAKMPHRLKDYGYEVNTGPLVWNRHKGQLRSRSTAHCYPLLWAESVMTDGTFAFSAARRNHEPFFEVEAGQEYLVVKDECLLVQRTTAKEQNRRLIAAVLPEEFLEKHQGAVVENHLNIVRPCVLRPAVPLKVVAALLNSGAVDDVFRCISGSVAVSAYELNAIPLPDPKDLGALLLLLRKKSREVIEQYVAHLYGDAENG